MNSLSIFDVVVMTLVGFLILVAVWNRYHTWGSARANFAIIINVAVFASFALGLSLLRPSVVVDFCQSASGIRFLLTAGFLGVLAYFFYSASTEAKFPEGLGRALVVGFLVGGFALGTLSAVFGYDLETGMTEERTSPFWLGLAFLLVMSGVGLIHGIFGPVVAAFNVAMTVGLLWEGTGVPNVGSIFNLFESLGIDSTAIGVLIVIGSTVLSLFEFLRGLPDLLHRWTA